MLVTNCDRSNFVPFHSIGYNDSDGTRQTQVENNHEYFIPPQMSLSRYLGDRDGKL